MKRVIQIILLIMIIILIYMCFVSIQRGMIKPDNNSLPIQELLENED